MSAENKLLEKHRAMCDDATNALEKCMAAVGKSDEKTVPMECTGVAIEQTECILKRREKAMEIAIKLAGKEQVERVFPFFEEEQAEAHDFLRVIKENASKESRDDKFWQPSM